MLFSNLVLIAEMTSTQTLRDIKNLRRRPMIGWHWGAGIEFRQVLKIKTEWKINFSLCLGSWFLRLVQIKDQYYVPIQLCYKKIDTSQNALKLVPNWPLKHTPSEYVWHALDKSRDCLARKLILVKKKLKKSQYVGQLLGFCHFEGYQTFADSAQTEYCITFHCSSVCPSQALHLTFLAYIKA